MRWVRSVPDGSYGCDQVISLRDTVGKFEDYEPMREMTRDCVYGRSFENAVSLSALTGELERLDDSSIILNRHLREVVLEKVSNGTSFSEIAAACGMQLSDLVRPSEKCGDSSWLKRRLGLMADSGNHAPSPWIRSDVLATIAREGLQVAPMEVEVL